MLFGKYISATDTEQTLMYSPASLAPSSPFSCTGVLVSNHPRRMFLPNLTNLLQKNIWLSSSRNKRQLLHLHKLRAYNWLYIVSTYVCVYTYTQSTYIYEQHIYSLNAKLRIRCSYKSKTCLDTEIHCPSSRQNYSNNDNLLYRKLGCTLHLHSKLLTTSNIFYESVI